LIVNTHSRSGENLFFRAMDGLEDRSIILAAAYPVRDPKRLPEFVKEAIGRGHKLIIIGGGDGTISSAVDFFVGKDIVLGVLPLGTGNSFARTLDIPMTLDGALDVIAKGKVAHVDVGEVDGHHFANVATIARSLSADVARYTPRWAKKIFGVAAYFFSGLWQFFAHRYFDCELIVDGKPLSIKTHQVVFANGAYYGTSKILPDIHIDNKKMLVFTMDSMDRWQIVKFWIALLTNGRIRFPETHYLQGKSIRIATRPRKWIDIDGEFTQKTPATIDIHPKALRVTVPQSFVDVD
ncbi:MAG: YegS/Rv2252/BmrU family lipid kinase, partial [Candidatus Pacebacteria bacterium]|nr:YegS/Rv2252/BmrU family lipid kinase [Candidatus Paceibacterota bacterium]